MEFNTSKCIKEAKPIEISLNDCLSCSGCITPDELSSLTKKDSERLILDKTDKLFLLSPFSKINLFTFLKKKGLEMTYQQFETNLTHFLKTECQATKVIDTSYFQKSILNSVKAEFIKRKKLIVSDCPGTVKYIESSGTHLIPYLSTTMTPQQVCNQYFNHPNTVSVVPCLDKKLENNRDNLTFQYFLTTKQFYNYLIEMNFTHQPTQYITTPPNQPPSSERTSFDYKSMSCGYTEHLLSNQQILHTQQINKGYTVYTTHNHTFLKIYGLKNVLSFMKQGPSFDFAEVFLCDNACVGGLGNFKNVEEDFFVLESVGCLERETEIMNLTKRVFVDKKSKRVNFKVEW